MMQWGRRKKDNQVYVKTNRKKLSMIIGSMIPNSGHSFFSAIQKSNFTPKSDLLKKIFGKKMPPSQFHTGFNFEKRKSYQVPILSEKKYLDSGIQAFLTTDGYFIDAGIVDDRGFRSTHGTILSILTGEQISDMQDTKVADVAQQLGLVRVGNTPTEIYIHVLDRLTASQLSRIKETIKEAETNEKELTFEIGNAPLRDRAILDKHEFFAELKNRGWI